MSNIVQVQASTSPTTHYAYDRSPSNLSSLRRFETLCGAGTSHSINRSPSAFSQVESEATCKRCIKANDKINHALALAWSR